MKKAVCLVLAAAFLLILCSCSADEPEVIEPIDETEMIEQMFSDLSQKNFEKIASLSVLSDGSNVKAEDIKSIYDCIVNTGADPSLGFTINEIKKDTNISAAALSSHTYYILALCGDKSVAFAVTVEKRSTGYFFTQIYTEGVVTVKPAETADTEV